MVDESSAATDRPSLSKSHVEPEQKWEHANAVKYTTFFCFCLLADFFQAKQKREILQRFDGIV